MENKKISIDEWIKRWEEECEKNGLPKPVPINKTGSFIITKIKVKNQDNN